MSRVSLKGVVVGGVVDIVASNLVALPVLVVAAAQPNVARLPKEEQGRCRLRTCPVRPNPPMEPTNAAPPGAACVRASARR